MSHQRASHVGRPPRLRAAVAALGIMCALAGQRAWGAQGGRAVTTDSSRAVAVRASRDSAATPTQAEPSDTGTVIAGKTDGDVGGRARSETDMVTEAAREYERTGVARTVEAGASVTFPYGHGQPTLTCAPLRACVIELEAGETVLSRIAGDTQRWEIELAPAGADGRTPLVVVKPHDCGLTTNLVLTTTAGRIYDLTLDSPPCAHGGVNPHGVYIRHVRFYYPDATVEAWTASPTPAAPARGEPTGQAAHVDAFNFAYRIRRLHRFPWAPLAVFDDGAHCYIKLPPQAAHRDAPVLFALRDDGSKELLNYSVTNETYVTDRVFRTAVLVLGEAESQQALRVDNLHFDAAPDALEPGPAAAQSTTAGAPQ
jgi:type IV secretion system protein TrbG